MEQQEQETSCGQKHLNMNKRIPFPFLLQMIVGFFLMNAKKYSEQQEKTAIETRKFLRTTTITIIST
jgi:hypothetical protein